MYSAVKELWPYIVTFLSVQFNGSNLIHNVIEPAPVSSSKASSSPRTETVTIKQRTPILCSGAPGNLHFPFCL